MQKVKNYIRTNTQLQKENEALKEQVKDVIHFFSEAMAESERYQFQCSCFEESKKQRIEKKVKFYTELFDRYKI
jgi:predicted nucleic acid-binding protein